MIPRRAFLVALLLVSACGRKEARHAGGGAMDPPSFWVWHRSSVLKPAETAALAKAGVRTLYWQVAECAWADGGWRVNRISAPMPSTAELKIIPVFRIQPESAFLGAPDAAGRLARDIRNWAGPAGVPADIQLDFDCPDRLLGNHARFLKTLGRELAPTRISITALASWPRHPDFGKLADAVSSFAPMFYDTAADDPAAVRDGRFRPMVDPSAAAMVALWSACDKPWFAGLPNFERVSVFGADGRLTGHLRGWEHDPVFFHPGLTAKPSAAGVTLLEAAAPVEFSGTRITPGMKTVHRMPEAKGLSQLASEAQRAGAAGILYFALSGPGIQAAYSAEHLAHPGAGLDPVVEIRPNGCLVLENPGPADLAARVWELEVTSAEPGGFRSASPGGFAQIEIPGAVPAELARSIVLRFSRLRAGESMLSGPMIARPDHLVWNIRGLTGDQPVIPEDSAR